MFRLSVRTRLALLWLLVAALFVIGLVFHWPFLVREHRRIEPWKGVLIWSSDGLALAGFLWFGITHFIRGKPFPAEEAGNRFDRCHWAVTICFLVGFLADGAVSWWVWQEEDLSLARAHVVWGEIIDAKGAERTDYFVVVCRFADDDGVVHVSDFPLARIFTPETNNRIRRGQFGMPIRVSFDPRWPDRNWLTECGLARGGDKLSDYSLCVLLLQALCLPFVLLGGCVWRTPAGVVPMYEILPALVIVSVSALPVVLFLLIEGLGF
jgi:hypothetical protein